jgi:hypothetical protein
VGRESCEEGERWDRQMVGGGVEKGSVRGGKKRVREKKEGA